MRKRRDIKSILLIAGIVIIFIILGFQVIIGSQGFLSNWLQLKGRLIGNSYTIYSYDNYGARSLQVKGNKIDVEGNQVKNSDGSKDLSSVITITVDGKEIESCGDTLIFEGKGLEATVDFTLNDIVSDSNNGISELTSVGKVLNKYKNYFGKSRVVVIKSQLGVPICAYEGKDVYYEIPSKLPKMTKLMIDGKPLYIHRANFQIIDTELIKDI